MRKKCNILAFCSLILSFLIYVFTYFLFHHLSPEGGVTTKYQKKPAKPFVTLLFGIWGVTFHFAGIISLLVGKIFFKNTET